MSKSFRVYMMADKPDGTIYIGVTNDIARRAYEHRQGQQQGFTKEYGLKMLVYCEEYTTASEAIEREKKLEKWKRDWKKQSIETINPPWRDLYDQLNH